MPDLQLNETRVLFASAGRGNSGDISEPERELVSFINSVGELIGPGSIRTLTEIWLDELACMDCIPEPIGKGWRIVSLRASASLASKLIASQLGDLDTPLKVEFVQTSSGNGTDIYRVFEERHSPKRTRTVRLRRREQSSS
jgi:hypothetical protein